MTVRFWEEEEERGSLASCFPRQTQKNEGLMCWEGERCSRVFITFCVDLRAKQALITELNRSAERGGERRAVSTK